jgi:putative transposase
MSIITETLSAITDTGQYINIQYKTYNRYRKPKVYIMRRCKAMMTYKFKLYQNKKNKKLHKQINIAARIYNHCIALHKRYYRLFGKSLNYYQLKKYITKIKKLKKYAEWNELNSQAIQNIVERIDKAYKLFFRNQKYGVKSAPPSFKKVKKYKSYTLTQTGYKLFNDNRIQIGKQIYKYSKSRNIEGEVKTVTIKRDTLGDIYITIVCETFKNEIIPRTGKIVGYDFGLKMFLKASDGKDIISPEFFKQSQKEIKKLNRQLSKKKKGSNNYKKAKKELARTHKKIADKRKDFHFKLALNLAGEYAFICLEDLNIKAMQKLWGKKISDLSHSSFVNILKYQCAKVGSKVVEIDRFYPSSKTCSKCGYIKKDLNLNDREWICPECNTVHDRDYNASINIERVGASTLGVEIIRPI